MSIWFEGFIHIDCGIERVKESLADLGVHSVGVVSLMPGLSKVELVDSGGDFVVIETNEGVMRRTNIHVGLGVGSVVVELDEDYKAGSLVTTKSHFREEFEASDAGVEYRVVISSVETTGVLGFFYRKLGSSNTGNAFLRSCKTFLELGGR